MAKLISYRKAALEAGVSWNGIACAVRTGLLNGDESTGFKMVVTDKKFMAYCAHTNWRRKGGRRDETKK